MPIAWRRKLRAEVGELMRLAEEADTASLTETFLLVSGTACIVGHESRHPGDLQRQLHETWRNLEQLCAEAGAVSPQMLRVYIRHASDHAGVAGFLAEHLPADVPVVYLLADICRAELLVEIEGVYRVLVPRSL